MHLRCDHTDADRPRGGITIDVASEAAAQLLCSVQSLLEDRPEPPCRPEKCVRIRELQKQMEDLEKHWTARLAHLSMSEVRARSAQHYYGLCAGTRLEYCLIPTLCSFDRLARTLEVLSEAGAVAPGQDEQIVSEAYAHILKVCRVLTGESATAAQDASLRGSE